MTDLDDIRIQRDEEESVDAPVVLRAPGAPGAPGALSGEVDLEQGSPLEEPEGESGSRGLVIGALLVLFLGAAAAGTYWFWLREPSVPGLGSRTVQPLLEPFPERPETIASDLSEPVTEGPPAWQLPALGDSDSVVRALVSTVTSHPRLAGWLVNDRLIERFARVVANVAFDEDPRVHLPFLRPDESFGARPSGEGWIVDGASYRRFSPLVEAFVSIDVIGASNLFRQFRPLVEQSYAELGYPGSFDGALAIAVERVLTLPTPPNEPEVTPWIHSFRFVDPALEALPPIQKLLLRMGPANVARVQRQVRRLHAAL